MQRALDHREGRQPLGEIHRYAGHMGEPDAHRLKAAQRQGGLIGRDADAEHPERVLEATMEGEVGDSDRAEQQIGMAADVFCQRLHGEIGAEGERLEQERRRPGIVAADIGALRLGRGDNRRQILDLHRARAGRLDPDEFGPAVDQVGHGRADHRVVNVVGDPARRQIVGAEPTDRRVHRVGDENAVARHQHGQHDHGDRRLARRHQDGPDASMQGRQLGFECARRRRAVQAISVTVRPAMLALGEGFGVVVDDGRGAVGRDREAGEAFVGDGGMMDAAG